MHQVRNHAAPAKKAIKKTKKACTPATPAKPKPLSKKAQAIEHENHVEHIRHGIQQKCQKAHPNDDVALHDCFRIESDKHSDELFTNAFIYAEKEDDEVDQDNAEEFAEDADNEKEDEQFETNNEFEEEF